MSFRDFMVGFVVGGLLSVSVLAASIEHRLSKIKPVSKLTTLTVIWTDISESKDICPIVADALSGSPWVVSARCRINGRP